MFEMWRSDLETAMAAKWQCRRGSIGREVCVEIVGRMRSARIIAHAQATYDAENLLLKG